MNRLRAIFRRKLVRILIVLLVLVINAIGWLQHWSNTPAETTIHIAATTPAADTKPTYQTISSKLFSSEVPSSWLIRKNTDTANLTQVLSFPNGSSLNHGQVAVTVDSLTGGGLSAVPDYNVRIQDKVNYQRQTTNLTGVSATFLDVNNGPGYTVFMVHGSRYAVVSVSQFATPDDAYAMLEHVLNTWKWLD